MKKSRKPLGTEVFLLAMGAVLAAFGVLKNDIFTTFSMGAVLMLAGLKFFGR